MNQTQSLAEFLPANVFAVMLVFMRVAGAIMLLPGFGDIYVPARYRLLIAMFLSAMLAASLAPILPVAPARPGDLIIMLGGEIAIGLFFGAIARTLLTALETAGNIIAFQLGLSAAQVFNPALQQTGALTSAFLSVLGVLVIFLTDTHHLMLRGIVASYGTFPPGAFPAVGDFSEAMTRLVSSSFALAVALSAPFIVLGTIFFVALGLLSRLMPQLQVFFVILPIQVAGGLVVFAFTLYAVMSWFLDGFTGTLGSIVPG
ncbi:MAG: flagellar biosynthetic protein FliR [Rhodospirillales bacterium]|jgi:flagellar biosynthetic protein FliR|nr:flagellar biosynthetic protein FliR [Rhodospirillales bacterium]